MKELQQYLLSVQGVHDSNIIAFFMLTRAAVF